MTEQDHTEGSTFDSVKELERMKNQVEVTAGAYENVLMRAQTLQSELSALKQQLAESEQERDNAHKLNASLIQRWEAAKTLIEQLKAKLTSNKPTSNL
jgi:chromosome segregation ATPase